MIVRGTASALEANRGGQLAPEQRARIEGLRAFRLPALPSIVAGLVLVLFGFARGDTLGWVVVGLGLYMALSGWMRYRQKTHLRDGEVSSFEGALERIQRSPLRSFEAELTIDGRSYVLLSDLGAGELRVGARYRSFVVNGISRMGIIVAMEEA